MREWIEYDAPCQGSQALLARCRLACSLGPWIDLGLGRAVRRIRPSPIPRSGGLEEGGIVGGAGRLLRVPEEAMY
jgi:hypothetical protein